MITNVTSAQIELIIEDKIYHLQRALIAQEHLTNPAEFAEELSSFRVLRRWMSEEYRVYLDVARFALEQQRGWRVFEDHCSVVLSL